MHVEGAPAHRPGGLRRSACPILGICYGAQLLARDLGGEVARTGRGEYGRTELDVVAPPACCFGGGQPDRTSRCG